MEAVQSNSILYNYCGSVEEEQKPFKRHSWSVIYFRFNYLSAKTTTQQRLHFLLLALAIHYSVYWDGVQPELLNTRGGTEVKSSRSSKNPMNFKFFSSFCVRPSSFSTKAPALQTGVFVPSALVIDLAMSPSTPYYPPRKQFAKGNEV